MALTDTRIRNAKPTAKPYKLSDGGGMYLLITLEGSRYWRVGYRLSWKRRPLPLRGYPNIFFSAAPGARRGAPRPLTARLCPTAGQQTLKAGAEHANQENP